MFVPTKKNLAADIETHISSVLRDLGMIIEKPILSGNPKFMYADSYCNLDSCSGTQNEQKIHIIM